MQEELNERSRRRQELEDWITRAIKAGQSTPEEETKGKKLKGTKATVTSQEEIAEYLEQNYHVVKQDNHCRVNSPYPTHIREYLYPDDYTSPKFKVYEGQGNAREHLSRFLSAMNDMAKDRKICLKEFPKSLTGTAFTWYDNLKEESVDYWQTLSTLFLRKFYSTKRKITAIYLSKNGFQTFVEIEEAAKRIADCIEEMLTDAVWRTTVSAATGTSRNVRPNVNEGGNQYHVDGRNQVRNGGSKREYKTPPPLPCSKECTIKLLNQWVADREIQLPPTIVDINNMDQNSAKYCCYHRRMGHPTEECFAIRSIFERKRAAGELEATRQTIEHDPFPRH
ncbi:uncharacterized protein LOC113312308 [Papaver somniferum]|uniref:uncharacterized protein LOC113312308 n=1 Tax=Papaver somniferum TaxID=3469 RepID=UPI000E6FDF39|nr:uncharacterized protein LOC113312308 [Papaver somniferum]